MSARTGVSPRRVTIVGGGFSGASVAVQLVRASSAPLAITVIEPRPKIGGGLAYSTDDSDHRLNAPIEGHLVDPADHTAFQRWCMERRIAERDPDAVAPDGSMFARRMDFGAFVNEITLSHARWPTGSTIHHVRDMATDASVGAGIIDVQTARGHVLASDLLIVATGNVVPRLPAEFGPDLSANPAIVAVPTDLESVRNIPADARVLVIGSGLTALDVLSTLIRSGHGGEITVISRRGLRPRSNLPRKAPPDVDLTRALLDRVAGRVAPFIQAAAGNTPAILGLLRALRAQIRAVESAGETWHMPFDELRDVVWQVWPTLPTLEKKRFMRHLRPWWDAHRFRTPPQNETIVRDAERNGRINFRAARLRSVTQGVDGSICTVLSERGKQNEEVEHFDAVINCESMLLPGRDTIHFSQRYSAKGLSALMEVASGFPLIPSAARSERTVVRTICFESSGRQMPAPSAIQSVPSLSRRRSAELCHVCWKHWESCRSSIGREGYSKALT